MDDVDSSGRLALVDFSKMPDFCVKDKMFSRAKLDSLRLFNILMKGERGDELYLNDLAEYVRTYRATGERYGLTRFEKLLSEGLEVGFQDAFEE